MIREKAVVPGVRSGCATKEEWRENEKRVGDSGGNGVWKTSADRLPGVVERIGKRTGGRTEGNSYPERIECSDSIWKLFISGHGIFAG